MTENVMSGDASIALRDVLAERRRQIEGENCSLRADDWHADGSLAAIASAYAFAASLDDEARKHLPTPRRFHTHADWISVVSLIWPRSWEATWFKPKDRRRDLVRAGALILAEIERLDRRIEVEFDVEQTR